MSSASANVSLIAQLGIGPLPARTSERAASSKGSLPRIVPAQIEAKARLAEIRSRLGVVRPEPQPKPEPEPVVDPAPKPKTLPKTLLAGITPQHAKVRRAARLIMHLYGVTGADLIGPRRTPNVVRARRNLVWFMYRNTRWRVAILARKVCRDHSTVLYALRTAAATKPHRRIYPDMQRDQRGWSDQDIAKFKEMFAEGKRCAEIMAALGRGEGAVRGQCARLRLHFPRLDVWLREEDAILRKMFGRYRAAEIGERLGRSKKAVTCRAHVLGLSNYKRKP